MGRFGITRWPALAVLAGAILATCDARAAGRNDGEFPRTVRVVRTFDGKPFEYTIHSETRKARYTVYRLSYPSPVVTPVPQNNLVPAEYYLPRGARPGEPPRPAAICLHILNGNYELVHLTCSMLASRGIPAIMFKLPYYDERGVPGGHDHIAADPKLFAGALSQAVLDVRRTYDVLASRPEVDPERIGVMGISLGAILAATSAGADLRIARVALILGGGNLRHVIRHAREARQLAEQIDRFPAKERTAVLRAIDAVDPLRHAERLRERARQGRVLMINAAEDEVIPRSCTEQLARALGIAERVVWLEGLGHYTSMAELPRIMRTTIAFFAEDLPPGVELADYEPRGTSPQEIVSRLLGQLAAMLTREPAEGYCHFVDVQFQATLDDDQPVAGRVRFVRGAGYRFRLDCQIEGLVEATLCQGQHPWMGSPGKTIFLGTLGSSNRTADPFQFADRDSLTKLRAAAGAAAGVALAPGVLEQWLQISDVRRTEGDEKAGPRTLRLRSKERPQDFVELTLRDDRTTPHRVRFRVGGVKGSATFRGWQIDTVAHEALFEPPPDAPTREVDPEKLYRIFSAMFNFAMENAL